MPPVRKKSKRKKQKPIEEKEGFRWLEGYIIACNIQSQCQDTKIVCISDSEGDIFECLSEGALNDENKADFIIRACQDRSIEGEIEKEASTTKKSKQKKRLQPQRPMQSRKRKPQPRPASRRARRPGSSQQRAWRTMKSGS